MAAVNGAPSLSDRWPPQSLWEGDWSVINVYQVVWLLFLISYLFLKQKIIHNFNCFTVCSNSESKKAHVPISVISSPSVTYVRFFSLHPRPKISHSSFLGVQSKYPSINLPFLRLRERDVVTNSSWTHNHISLCPNVHKVNCTPKICATSNWEFIFGMGGVHAFLLLTSSFP